MGECNCKNKQLRRAKVILNNRKWEDLNDIEQGQIIGMFQNHHGSFPSNDEEVINWVNSK